MPINAKALVEAKSVEQVQTTQYVVAVTATIIDKMTATNYSSAARTISVNLVPAGQLPGDSNLIVKAKTLQPSETYTFPEIAGHVMNTGDYISTLGSLAASMNFRASGREIS
jgi:hypothetical protein